MLGEILGGLTDPARAGEILAIVGKPQILERIIATAAAEGADAGALVAGKVRHLLEHGSEEVWLDLVGVMANSPQPAAAAVERILAQSFPDPVRVRVTRSGHAHE